MAALREPVPDAPEQFPTNRHNEYSVRALIEKIEMTASRSQSPRPPPSPELLSDLSSVFVIIPALNEESSFPLVLRNLP